LIKLDEKWQTQAEKLAKLEVNSSFANFSACVCHFSSEFNQIWNVDSLCKGKAVAHSHSLLLVLLAIKLGLRYHIV